jgi:hypothetical protein
VCVRVRARVCVSLHGRLMNSLNTDPRVNCVFRLASFRLLFWDVMFLIHCDVHEAVAFEEHLVAI